MHHDLYRVATVSAEVLLDQLPDRHRLGVVRLPASPGKVAFHTGREGGEADEHDEPRHQHRPAVIDDPGAEAAQRTRAQ